jgi:hypothetical protein
MLEKLSGYGLSSYVGPYDSLVVDEALDNRYNMGILSSNIDNK